MPSRSAIENKLDEEAKSEFILAVFPAADSFLFVTDEKEYKAEALKRASALDEQ
jgi:hypothetical protein